MCAQMDYVGVGLLISASVGTFVHYGLYCHEALRVSFLLLCIASAVLGTVFPFMDWFDKYEYRVSVTPPLPDVPKRSDWVPPVVPGYLLPGIVFLSRCSFGLHGLFIWVLGNRLLHK